MIFEGQPDLERRPEFWEPWSDGAADIHLRVTAIEEGRTSYRREEKLLHKVIEEHIESHPNLGVLPIGGIPQDIGLLLDRDTLEIIDVIYANPWPVDNTRKISNLIPHESNQSTTWFCHYLTEILGSIQEPSSKLTL